MSTPEPEIIAAARAGNLAEVNRLLATGIPVDLHTDKKGSTALIIASEGGYVEIVMALLAAGANVNYQNKSKFSIEFGNLGGMSALSFASMHGHVGVIRALLAAGAHVDIKDGYLRTPLFRACRYSRSPETVRLLLSAGADVNAINLVKYIAGERSLFTPLMEASGNGGSGDTAEAYLEIMRILIEAGANVNYLSKNYNSIVSTALHRAAYAGSVAEVRLLLEAGARPDLKLPDHFAHITAEEMVAKTKIADIKADIKASVIALLKSPPPRVDYFGIAQARRGAERGKAELDERIAADFEGYSQTLLKMARTTVRQLFEDIEDETRQETVQATLHRFLLTSEHVKRAGVDLPDDPSHAANRASLVTQLVTDLKAKKYLWKGGTFDVDEMTDELKSSVLLWSEKMKSGAAERSRLERIEDRLAGLSMGGGGSAGPAGAGTGAGAPGFATTFAQNAGKAAGMEAGKRIGLAVVKSFF